MRRPKIEDNCHVCKAIAFQDCLAKTRTNTEGPVTAGRSVWEHCLIVGNIAQELAKLFPKDTFKTTDIKTIGLLASLHDLGKICPSFQNKLKRVIEDNNLLDADRIIEERHQFHGGVTYISLRDWGLQDKLAWALGSHHKILIKGNLELLTSTSSLLGGVSWENERQNFFKNLKKYFQVEEIPYFDDYHAETIAGITQQADWLGSAELFEDPNIQWKKLTVNLLKDNGYAIPSIKKNLTFKEIFGFSPRQIQQDFIDAISAPGVYILEAPMGIGKTEAALYAAYKMLNQGLARGIYFALPTCLTSLKIKERVDEFLSKIQAESDLSSQIIVGSRFDSGALSPGKSWFSQRSRRILDTFGVGTLDQALFASMINKRSFATLAGLAGKVVILDEVHSYDFFTRVFLETLVKKLSDLGSTVLILSATLSSDSKKALLNFSQTDKNYRFNDSYPLITHYSNKQKLIELPSKVPSQQTVSFDLKTDTSAVIEEVIKRARSGQQILWIENSVADCQRIYSDILAKYDLQGIELGLIHSRFLPSHRRELEDHWVSIYGKNGIEVRNEQGRILIGTQVLEQSLDIDADFLVSRLAPIDLLLQRIGRLWRHSHIKRPVTAKRQIWIITPEQDQESLQEDFAATYRVYYPYILRRTKEVLTECTQKTFQLPEQIRNLIESVYQDRTETDSYFSDPLNAMLHGDGKRKGIIEMRNLAKKAEVTENCQETRLSDPMTDLLIVRSIKADKDNRETTLCTFDNEMITLPWVCNDHSLKARLSRLIEKQLLSIRRNSFTPKTDTDLLIKTYHLNQYVYLEDSPLWIAVINSEGMLRSLGEDCPSAFSYRFRMASGNLGLQYLKRKI